MMSVLRWSLNRGWLWMWKDKSGEYYENGTLQKRKVFSWILMNFLQIAIGVSCIYQPDGFIIRSTLVEMDHDNIGHDKRVV